MTERNKHLKPVTSADFDQNYEPIGPSYPASTPSTYTCSTGDTLRSVALALWGDSEMWFLLAQVNNLQADVSLAAGQVLIVPNRVTNIHNNAFTFRPYNPGEVIGHIDPTLPAPPPPPHQGGCGGVGTIIMVVVAVVVTIYTAGAASTLLAGGSLGGFGATMTAGVGVLGGGAAVGAAGGLLSAGMAGLAGAAIGGAVGSIASQAVGMAIGATDDFSWKAVAHGALAAGATAGVGSMLQGAGVINETGNLITESGEVTNWTRMGGAALSQGLSSAATQAIEGKWSWRQIASAAVGGAAGAAAGSAMNSAFGTSAGSDFARFSKGLASSVAGGWTSSRVMATDPRYRTAELSSLFASGFGNALGQGIVDEMVATDQQEQREAKAEYLRELNRARSTLIQNMQPEYTGGKEWVDDVSMRRDEMRQAMPEWIKSGKGVIGYGAVDVDRSPTGFTFLDEGYLEPATNFTGLSSDALFQPGLEAIVPGSYGGDYITRSNGVSDDGTLRHEITYHRGHQGVADEFLQKTQDAIDQLVRHTQDEGAAAYARGDKLSAAMAAVSYLPDRLVGDTLKGIVGIPRLYASNTLVPGLANAVMNPTSTASSAYSTFSGLSLHEKVIAGVELFGPGALKATSYAGSIPGVGKFLTGELGYGARMGTTITAGSLRYGFIGDGVSSAGALGRQRGAVGGVTFGVLDETAAPGANLAPNVRAYPDGSLRTPDGKFASVAGQPAPGTVNASNYAEFLRSNGIEVVGTELEVAGPLGVRKYDIGTLNPDGSIFGIEIKSGGAMLDSYQEFSDMFVDAFGGVGRGRIAGQPVTGSMTIYLPSGG